MRIVVPLLMAFNLCACAATPEPAQPPTPEAAAAADRFGAQHRFQGRTANAAARELREQGYSCFIESQEKPGRFWGRTRVPELWCSKWVGATGSACREERVALEVEWQDPAAANDALLRQLLTQRVTGQRYTCVPPRD